MNGDDVDLMMENDAPALSRFNGHLGSSPPEIVFPRDGIELFMPENKRGFRLAARGGARDYRWYVNGEPVRRTDEGERVLWRPGRSGFYDVTVVDKDGRAASAKVRVASAE